MTNTFTKKDILTIATKTNIFNEENLINPIKCMGLLLNEVMLMIPSGQHNNKNFDEYSGKASQFILKHCPEIKNFLERFTHDKELTQDIIETLPGYEDLPEKYNVDFGKINKCSNKTTGAAAPTRKKQNYGSFFIAEGPSAMPNTEYYQSGTLATNTIKVSVL